ncbi:hypothetical protein ASZ90_014728 [hydrocarbon metagenome]|uniref:Uncharacterized protein n=1 Tax=hydrocarbon metagenome TaxID=938273 RepID=A0A0W8F470_9ZZZZ
MQKVSFRHCRRDTRSFEKKTRDERLEHLRNGVHAWTE